MRYKIQISAPTILSTGVFVFGLVAILLYSLDVNKGRLGSEFVISISLQTLRIYLLGLVLCSFFIFKFLTRKGE
jgi:hypothetical protein